MELAVDVTTDGDWGADGLDVALLDEDLLDFLAENAQVAFGEHSASFDGVEP